MDLLGQDFSDSRDSIIIFSDSRNPIFNSRDQIGFLNCL